MTVATLTSNQSMNQKVEAQPLFSSWAIAAEQQRAATAEKINQTLTEAKQSATIVYQQSTEEAKRGAERALSPLAMMVPMVLFLVLVAACYHVNLMGLARVAPMMFIGALAYAILSVLNGGYTQTSRNIVE